MAQPGFTSLFLDLNSYFASVEQQLRPELRGKPVGVAAVDTDFTVFIAASYEAKAFGIKTGTNVGKAKELCPGIQVVIARPPEYVKMHHEIVAAVESCLPVQTVYSIDEMHCRLTGSQCQPENAIALARHIKQTIRDRVGECMRCSIGLATNRLLAKLATDMQKPDGLVTIAVEDLPEKLFPLELTDLPGIGNKMKARLNNRGITTMRQLLALDENQMVDLWNGVLGSRWWHWLRGDDIYEAPTKKGQVGQQHVLPPEQRNAADARAILARLIHKAAARLRAMDYCAQKLTVWVRHKDAPEWSRKAPLAWSQDTIEMMRIFAEVWPTRPASDIPFMVGVTLSDIKPAVEVTDQIFTTDQNRAKLAHAMDELNSKYGKHTIYPAAMHKFRDSAPMRIAFSSIPDPELPE